MSPLSRDLSGIILAHDYYGKHLDSSGKTQNTELEKRNFKRAGELLAGIWAQTTIAEHSVVAEYIDPAEYEPVAAQTNELWKSMHVKTSKYMTQIVKCNNRTCCGPFRSSQPRQLPNRFLPFPRQITDNDNGLQLNLSDPNLPFAALLECVALQDLPLPQQTKAHIISEVPFDLACPTVITLDNNHCKDSDLYYNTNTAYLSHRSGCHGTRRQRSNVYATPVSIIQEREGEFLCVMSDGSVEWHLIDDVVLDVPICTPVILVQDIPVIDDHHGFVASPWVDVDLAEEEFDEEL